MLPQDTTHLIQRPCYHRGSPCQDPAGNWTTRGSPDDRKQTQTSVVWSCFPFIRFFRSGQNHLARHSERGKKTRRTKEELGRQHQKMDRPGVCQVPEGSEEQGDMEKTGCKLICGAPTTLAVKGLMMMMMMPDDLEGFRFGRRHTPGRFAELAAKHSPNSFQSGQIPKTNVRNTQKERISIRPPQMSCSRSKGRK